MPEQGEFRTEDGEVQIYSDTDANGKKLPEAAWRKANIVERTTAMAQPGASTVITEWPLKPGGTATPRVWFPVQYNNLTGAAASEALAKAAKAANVPLGRFLRNLPDFQTARQRALDHASAQGHSLTDIEIIVEAGALSYKLKDEPDTEPVDVTFTHFKDDAGNVWMYDKDDPNALANATQIVTAVTTVNVNDPGVEPAGSVTNADRSVTKFYTVTDMQGRTSMQSVTTPAALRKEDVVPIDGGRLIPRGNGTYDFVADPKAAFETSIKDVIDLPDQNGSLVKTSENQYQFVRDTYEPGVKIDPQTGRQFVQSASGNWTELDPRADPGVVSIGDRDFLQQYTGALSELDPRYEPEVTDVDGMALLQQRTGAISQLAKPNLDQIITQALVDGEYDKAFAFQDFRDRPSAQETFQTALQFARSPADQILISSIARGEQTVQPPPAGTIQRVGPQPDFLVQAYQDFQRRTQAGRAPTEEEATGLSARAAAGASPMTDSLQARLEGLTRDQERRDEKHAIEIQGMKQSLFEQGELFKVKLDTGLAALNTKLGLNGDGSEPSLTVSTDGDDVSTAGSDTAAAAASAAAAAGTTAASEEEITEAVDKGVANERLTPEQIQHFQDFKDAKAAGFNPDDYNNIASRAINAWKESVRVAEEQTAFETQTAGQLTSLGIPTEVGDITNQAQFFDALNLGPSPSYQDVAAAITPLTDGQRTSADIAAFTDPQGTAAAAAQAEAAQASAARDLALTEKQQTPEHIAASGMGTQSSQDAMALIRDIESKSGYTSRAGGGTVRPGEITVVGEQGPEIAMMPPGTHILPLGRATKRDIRAAQSTGRAYQQGGIVFGELPFGLRQLQAGRPITPSRGYLSQAAGLTLPSAQALSNITPESRDVFFDLAQQAGIPSRAFGQELQTAIPRGARLPTSRMLPLGRRGVR